LCNADNSNITNMRMRKPFIANSLSVYYSDNVNIINSSFENISWMYIYSSNNINVSRINLTSFVDFFVHSSYSTFESMLLKHGAYCFVLSFADHNILKDSELQDCEQGISLANSGNNLIYNNLFNSTNNTVFYSSGSNNWNTTMQVGKKIYPPGNYIGGNYWTNSTGNDYSDTCTDSDEDGFCDESYTLAVNNIDYLPLSKFSTMLSSCANLSKEGETYYLVSDIINSSASICMNISANNVTLDCQGHIIDGINVSGTQGIYVPYSFITIKNCVLTEWEGGINTYHSNSNIISNITSYNNLYAGIHLYSSSNNTIINSTSNFNYGYGIRISHGSNNTIINSTTNFNTWGIDLSFENTTNNTIISSTSNFNIIGIEVDNFCFNNTIYNNIVKGNINYGIRLGSSSSSNLIYNNLFNNTNNFYLLGNISFWNTTKQTGTRIYSPGTEIGGNYWTNPDGNGYSDTCRDSDEDGFCDEPYVLVGDNIDYLPLRFTIRKYDQLTLAVLSIIPFAISIGMISLVLRRSLAEFNVEYIVGLSIIILITIALLIAIIEAI